MVKNVSGGSGQKSKARKYESKKDTRLRVPEEEGEELGYIVKNNGGGICRVITKKGNSIEEMRGHIRGKFRSRNRKDNNITAGCLVMVGMREWEGENKKECDILEVYNEDEIRMMSSMGKIMERMKELNRAYQNMVGGGAKQETCNDVEFTQDIDLEIHTQMDTSEQNEEEQIDIDDI